MGRLVKKKDRTPSLHSRAARRATSPSVDTDKSLKFVPVPTTVACSPFSFDVQGAPDVFSARRHCQHAAGVNKKKKSTGGRKSALSHRARRRHERNMNRAKVVVERTAVKVAKSKGQAKALGWRRRAWEEFNLAVAVVGDGSGGASGGGAGVAGLATSNGQRGSPGGLLDEMMIDVDDGEDGELKEGGLDEEMGGAAGDDGDARVEIKGSKERGCAGDNIGFNTIIGDAEYWGRD